MGKPFGVTPIGPGVIGDAVGVPSLDYWNRHAVNASGRVAEDWQDMILIDPSGNTAIQWGNRLAMDSSGNGSMDWQNRALVIGTRAVIDWENDWLYAGATAMDPGILVADWGNQWLYDATGGPGSPGLGSINWTSRWLAIGTNAVLDWENDRLFAGVSPTQKGSRVADWGLQLFYDGTGSSGSAGVKSLDWNSRYLYDETGSIAMNWMASQTTTMGGSTGGNVALAQPMRGPVKLASLIINSLSGTATVNYPAAFAYTPVALNTVAGVTVTPGTSSVTVSCSGAHTGQVFLIGQ